ncbi:MAG: type II secretion system F family protein [Atopobiaceae bacterium]|jgi:type IV pilus assembly protein PilC|nr:type II secretion system F family protein [Atopobiaceae bacterium]MCH4181032.1 type II secretion system F family protein [Atopobiaceae bacterium]MCH4213763.1 type II secretion system F family protein [Atopobiaceae bacterium]MCH4277049.1 type II secretion system F family protein [Atopobiaceae bacterium]MCI1226981.1 type II secretion system F family protein [Atopobiaceae bacterium]
MKAFKYTGRTSAGAEVDGIFEAHTQAEAVDALKANGLVIESIEETAGEHDIDLRLGGHRTKDKALSITCNQLSIILKTGMPIVRCLQLVSGQSDDKTLKKLLLDVSEDVAAGHGLADSFAEKGTGLPLTFIETVRAGEESGSLDVVFARLAEYYEKSAKTKSRVTSSMIYPCFVLGVAVIVVAVIMVYAVPIFESTFTSMNLTLPAVTQFVIDSSHFWTRYFLVIAGFVVALFIGVKFAKKNDDFHMWWSHLGCRIPVIGRITRMSSASQFAGTMSVMMEAGLSIVKSVEVTARSINNYWMSANLASIQPDLEAGKPLADSLAKTEAYPDMVCEMCGVGEQTGTLEYTLKVLGDYYDNEVATSTSRALSIMEPVTIVILAVIVCVLLLAVYLPVFDIYGGITA